MHARAAPVAKDATGELLYKTVVAPSRRPERVPVRRRSMKSILVASDLSAGSERALKRAVVFAAQTGARVTCLNVIDAGLTGAAAEARRRDAETTLKAQLAGAQDVPVDVRIVPGNHIDAIQAAAKDESADLLVIGMHHSVTELDLFRNSTGERVLKSGTRPVLMVKQAVTAPYRRVLVAVDFSASSRDAVAFAIRALPQAELTLVHVSPPRGGAGLTEPAQTKFAEFLAGLEGAPPAARQLAEQGPPVPTLMKAIERLAPDLVVVGTHGRTGVGPLQIGTVAERVLSQSAVDVLAVRT